jgi:hypothetical protein
LAPVGYKVVAHGPPYGFEVVSEVNRLRLLMASLGDRPTILAGSYRAIHALRLPRSRKSESPITQEREPDHARARARSRKSESQITQEREPDHAHAYG